MNNVIDAYFGWRQPAHDPDCKRTGWEVDTRSTHDAYRRRGLDGCDHSCPNEDSGHTNDYTTVTVRLWCPSCPVVHLLEGESNTVKTTTTPAIGYGSRPRKVGRLWLYPGPPLLDWETEPEEYLCTLELVDRLEPQHVVGCIGRGLGKRGGVIWGAAALPELTTSRFSSRPQFSYAVRSGETRFNSATAAAKWIQAHLEAAPAHPPGNPQAEPTASGPAANTHA